MAGEQREDSKLESARSKSAARTGSRVGSTGRAHLPAAGSDDGAPAAGGGPLPTQRSRSKKGYGTTGAPGAALASRDPDEDLVSAGAINKSKTGSRYRSGLSVNSSARNPLIMQVVSSSDAEALDTPLISPPDRKKDPFDEPRRELAGQSLNQIEVYDPEDDEVPLKNRFLIACLKMALTCSVLIEGLYSFYMGENAKEGGEAINDFIFEHTDLSADMQNVISIFTLVTVYVATYGGNLTTDFFGMAVEAEAQSYITKHDMYGKAKKTPPLPAEPETPYDTFLRRFNNVTTGISLYVYGNLGSTDSIAIMMLLGKLAWDNLEHQVESTAQASSAIAVLGLCIFYYNGFSPLEKGTKYVADRLYGKDPYRDLTVSRLQRICKDIEKVAGWALVNLYRGVSGFTIMKQLLQDVFGLDPHNETDAYIIDSLTIISLLSGMLISSLTRGLGYWKQFENRELNVAINEGRLTAEAFEDRRQAVVCSKKSQAFNVAHALLLRTLPAVGMTASLTLNPGYLAASAFVGVLFGAQNYIAYSAYDRDKAAWQAFDKTQLFSILDKTAFQLDKQLVKEISLNPKLRIPTHAANFLGRFIRTVMFLGFLEYLKWGPNFGFRASATLGVGAFVNVADGTNFFNNVLENLGNLWVRMNVGYPTVEMRKRSESDWMFVKAAQRIGRFIETVYTSMEDFNPELLAGLYRQWHPEIFNTTELDQVVVEEVPDAPRPAATTTPVGGLDAAIAAAYAVLPTSASSIVAPPAGKGGSAGKPRPSSHTFFAATSSTSSAAAPALVGPPTSSPAEAQKKVSNTLQELLSGDDDPLTGPSQAASSTATAAAAAGSTPPSSLRRPSGSSSLFATTAVGVAGAGAPLSGEPEPVLPSSTSFLAGASQSSTN